MPGLSLPSWECPFQRFKPWKLHTCCAILRLAAASDLGERHDLCLVVCNEQSAPGGHGPGGHGREDHRHSKGAHNLTARKKANSVPATCAQQDMHVHTSCPCTSILLPCTASFLVPAELMSCVHALKHLSEFAETTIQTLQPPQDRRSSGPGASSMACSEFDLIFALQARPSLRRKVFVRNTLLQGLCLKHSGALPVHRLCTR